MPEGAEEPAAPPAPAAAAGPPAEELRKAVAGVVREAARRRALAKRAAGQVRTLLGQRERAEARRAEEERRAARAVAASLSREVGKFWRRCCEVVQREEDLRSDALDRQRRIESLEAMVSRTEALSHEVSGRMQAPSDGSEDGDESMRSGTEGESQQEEEPEEEAEACRKETEEEDDDDEDEEEEDGDDEALNEGRDKDSVRDKRSPPETEPSAADPQDPKGSPDDPKASPDDPKASPDILTPNGNGLVGQGGAEERRDASAGLASPAVDASEARPPLPDGSPDDERAAEKSSEDERNRLWTAMESFTKEMGEDANFDRKNLSKHITTEVPALLLRRPIREYQHVGLHWLATLHDKNFNGILADEMGLGKTVMTIALLAHLAIAKEVWGPHLIVVPTSVQINWEMEFKRWVPGFKVLTYYGTSEERRQKRRGWQNHDSFNACIVSYAIAIQDARILKMKPWYYMILDEAQHIKNFRSQKWQQLIRFKTARRLLLTGTPLQNDLMELWSLMHFLMPDVFASYSDFKGWFSDPLNLAIQRQTVSQECGLISRLHEVLRPFMLRRLKSEVEKQMPAKHEYVERCALSRRQQVLYEEFMELRETQRVLRQGDYLGMMSVLMQLRKVCNHPELFEPRRAATPFAMAPLRLCLPGRALLSLWAAVGGRRRGEPGFCSLLLPLLSLWRHEAEQVAACRGTLVLASLPRSRQRSLCEFRGAGAGAIWRTMPLRPCGFGHCDLTADGNGPGQSLRAAAPGGAAGFADAGHPWKRRRLEQVRELPAAVGASAAVALGGRVVATAPARAAIGNAGGAMAALTQGIPAALPAAPVRISARSAAFFEEARFQLERADRVRRQERENATKAMAWLCWEIGQDFPLWGADGLDLISLAGDGRVPAGSPLSWGRTLNGQSRPRRSPLALRWRPPGADAGAGGLQQPPEPSQPSAPPRTLRLKGVEVPPELSAAALGGFAAGGDACGAPSPAAWGSWPASVLGGTRPKVGRTAWRRRRRRRSWWEEGGSLERLCRVVHDELEADLEARVCHWVLLVPRVRVVAEHPRSLIRPLDHRAAPRPAPLPPTAAGAASAPTPHVTLLCRPAPGELAWRQRAAQEEARLHRALRGACPCDPRVLTRVVAPMLCRLPERRHLESDCGKLARLRVLLQDFRRNGSKCIIFTQFSKMLDVLEAFVSHNRFTYLRLDGSVKVEMRQSLVDCFNNDERIFLFIASTRAGGVGINLTGANVVIFYDSDWNPAMDRQAMDRAHRIGQTRDVHIYRLLSEHTVEENIWRRQLQKRQLDDVVVDQGRFNAESLQGAGSGRRASLWTAGEVRSMLTGDLGGGARPSGSSQVRALLTGAPEAAPAPGRGPGGGGAPSAATGSEGSQVGTAAEPSSQGAAQAGAVELEGLLRAVEDRDDAELAERAARELRETERVFERDFSESIAAAAAEGGAAAPGTGAAAAERGEAAKDAATLAAAQGSRQWLECLPALVRWGVCRVQMHGVSEELRVPGARARNVRPRRTAARASAKSRMSRRR